MDDTPKVESATTLAEGLDLRELIMPSLGSCFRIHEIVDSPFQVRVLFSDASLLLYQSNLPTLLHGVFGEQGILLLGLDKRFLEKVGI